MRVVIIHQYFKEPKQGGPIRSYYLAKGLLAYGHEVEVITAHNKKTESKTIEGIRIHYLPVYYDNKLGAISRINAFLKFVYLATKKTFLLPKADVNYVISTPLSIGFVALALKYLRKTPYVFEIGDLWPEAPIQLGYIKNILLKRVLYWFEKLVYRKAQSIVAMSPDIESHVLQSKTNKSILMIPNMADCQYYGPVSKPKGVLKKYDLEDKFVISYVGTAGRANHLEYLIEVARKCVEETPSVQFLIAASGRELSKIKELASKYGLSNISFVSYLNREGVKELLEITDAVYISFANVPILSAGSPNKFFDGLAAGKLIITNFGGWTEQEILDNGCGFTYDPNRPTDFVNKISPYVDDSKLLELTQRNARRLAEKKYDRNTLTQEWVSLFE